MTQRNASKFVAFLEYKTHVVFFFIFHFMLLYFFPNEYPALSSESVQNPKMGI